MPEMRDAALLEESDEVTQPLGGFRQVATTVSCEPRAIFSYQVFIHLVDGIPMSVQPVRKLLSGAQKTLDATWSIACVVERGRKVIEVRPEWTAPQPGNGALSYKGLVEHVLFLFRKVDWKRNRIARLDHAK